MDFDITMLSNLSDVEMRKFLIFAEFAIFPKKLHFLNFEQISDLLTKT